MSNENSLLSSETIYIDDNFGNDYYLSDDFVLVDIFLECLAFMITLILTTCLLSDIWLAHCKCCLTVMRLRNKCDDCICYCNDDDQDTAAIAAKFKAASERNKKRGETSRRHSSHISTAPKIKIKEPVKRGGSAPPPTLSQLPLVNTEVHSCVPTQSLKCTPPPTHIELIKSLPVNIDDINISGMNSINGINGINGTNGINSINNIPNIINSDSLANMSNYSSRNKLRDNVSNSINSINSNSMNFIVVNSCTPKMSHIIQISQSGDNLPENDVFCDNYNVSNFSDPVTSATNTLSGTATGTTTTNTNISNATSTITINTNTNTNTCTNTSTNMIIGTMTSNAENNTPTATSRRSSRTVTGEEYYRNKSLKQFSHSHSHSNLPGDFNSNSKRNSSSNNIHRKRPNINLNESQINIIISIVTSLCMISYTISPLLLGIDRLRWYITKSDENIFWTQLPYLLSYICLNFAKLCLYILLLTRVYCSFQNSLFAYNYKLICLIIAVCVLFQPLYYFVVFRFYLPHYIWITFQSIDILIVFFILFLLASRLFRVSKAFDDSTLLWVLSKATVLTIISLITSSVLATFYCILWIESDSMFLQYWIDSAIVDIDCVVNCFCVYLIFSFNKNEYKCCCKCCHLCVNKIYSVCLDDA